MQFVPDGAHFVVANAVSVASFGGVWIAKYFFLNTVVFVDSESALVR